MSKIEVNTVEPQCGTTLTLGGSGDTVALASGASQTGFGASGAVSWNTTKITADPANAVSGTGYFCDTSGGGFTVTLPTSPSAGDIVAVSDYTGSFATYNLTIGRNSSNINGAASNFVIFQNNTSAQFIYVDVTEGWRLVMTGALSDVEEIATFVTATGGTPCAGAIVSTDYKVHTFTGPGTFTVTNAGSPTGSNSVDYMVVGGGASGGKYYGGGAGAGGYRESPGAASGCYTASPLGVSPAAAIAVSASPGSYSIVVGGGAAGVPGCNTPGLDGNVSTFSSITSAGGGGGGGSPTPTSCAPGRAGGSGGGGAYTSATGGAGNTPSVTPPQGQPGGTPTGSSSGGGGALNAGPNSNTCAGGAGAGTEINPSPSYGTPGPSAPLRYFAGGGASAGGGGASVGGGGPRDSGPGAGTVNTGGGGAGNLAGGGGSGVVIIRYKFQ